MADTPHKTKTSNGTGPPTRTTPADAGSGEMEFAEFDELDIILEDLRTRNDETPQWEFCEGFIAALICCRRLIPPSEYLPVLLNIDLDGGMVRADDEIEPREPADFDDLRDGSFANEAQLHRFMALWVRRWNEVAESLNADVETLDDERTYFPAVMDMKGAVAALSPEARAGMPGGEIPSYCQVWAIGFMYAVENWLEEWAAPRDKQAGKVLDEALQAIVALTADDTDIPTESLSDEDGPPTVSQRRLDEVADAVWAVYNLRDLWRNFGERVAPVRADTKPGRNDPCFCGSGKKYKKCHGA